MREWIENLLIKLLVCAGCIIVSTTGMIIVYFGIIFGAGIFNEFGLIYFIGFIWSLAIGLSFFVFGFIGIINVLFWDDDDE